MPARRRCPPLRLQSPGDRGTKLGRPTADRRTADVDPADRHQLLHISEAEIQTEIESDRVTDHIDRDAMRLNAIGFTIIHIRQRLAPTLPETSSVCLTAPLRHILGTGVKTWRWNSSEHI